MSGLDVMVPFLPRRACASAWNFFRLKVHCHWHCAHEMIAARNDATHNGRPRVVILASDPE